MQVTKTKHGGTYIVAMASLFLPEDSALFDDINGAIHVRREVLDWLEQVISNRCVIRQGGRVILFMEMNDAIHFKLRWS